jgi:hypothetical protein
VAGILKIVAIEDHSYNRRTIFNSRPRIEEGKITPIESESSI